ncbi:MAG: hypothetical protein ACYC23_16970 [Limisphaerales bacterium]
MGCWLEGLAAAMRPPSRRARGSANWAELEIIADSAPRLTSVVGLAVEIEFTWTVGPWLTVARVVESSDPLESAALAP